MTRYVGPSPRYQRRGETFPRYNRSFVFSSASLRYQRSSVSTSTRSNSSSSTRSNFSTLPAKLRLLLDEEQLLLAASEAPLLFYFSTNYGAPFYNVLRIHILDSIRSSYLFATKFRLDENDRHSFWPKCIFETTRGVTF